MVAAISNTRCTILRGTTSDGYGDVTDAGIPVMTGIPASVIETGRTVFDPATQAPRTVRATTCVLPPWAGVLNTDQIRDETSGDLYMVEEILLPPTLMGAPVDVTLTLRRVTGAAA